MSCGDGRRCSSPGISTDALGTPSCLYRYLHNWSWASHRTSGDIHDRDHQSVVVGDPGRAAHRGEGMSGEVLGRIPRV